MGDSVRIDEILAKRAKQKQANMLISKQKKRFSLTNMKSVIKDDGESSLLSVLLRIKVNNKDEMTAGSNNSANWNSIRKKINENDDIEDYMENLLDDDEDDERLRALDHQAVCSFLSENIEPDSLSIDLVRIYLQYCIFVWCDKNESLNNLLIDSYIRFIENESDVDLVKKYKQMLVYFLNETKHYSPAYALSKLELDKYAEERAIVLGKLGKHHEALSIYVKVLNDTDKAEAYCDSVYANASSQEAKQVMLVTLFN